eukprot:TRINITY_DN220_c0_g1_i7.p1 TRINITY_DN220_c0_g1~~TRINITY_DN220_c0_g1_i7.p1  ORF type:complete len:991 (-),score=350.14 TRINITY_DN220_c0_g1_i7:115-3087(-)
MSGEAVRRRHAKGKVAPPPPPKLSAKEVPDYPGKGGSGSGCCVKLLFFSLLSSASLISVAMFTDYQTGQLREAYVDSVPKEYRLALEQGLLSLQGNYEWALAESAKQLYSAKASLRTTLKGINCGEATCDTYLFAPEESMVKASKAAKTQQSGAKVKADNEAKLKAEKAAKEAKLKAEKEATLKAEQETKLKAEKEAKLKTEQEAKLKAEKDAKIKAEQEAKLKAEKEAKLKAEKEAKLKAEQEAKLKAVKEAKLKAEQEAKLKAELEAKLKAEQEAKLKAEKEAKVKAEQEAKLKAEKEAKLKAEQEAKLKAEKESKLKAEKEAKLKAEQEVKLKAEKEAKLKAEKESKLKAEKEAKLKAEQEAKLKAEKEAKAKAEKEAKLKTEKEAKLKAEKETKLKAEQEAKIKAEKEAKLKAEQEAKLRAEMEAKLKAEKEAKLKAEKEAKLKAEKEAKLKAEQEAKLKAEKEAKLKAEQEASAAQNNVKKAPEDPSEIRSKIQSSDNLELEAKRKQEQERLQKENHGNNPNSKSQKDRNEALDAAKKAAKLNNENVPQRLPSNAEDALLDEDLQHGESLLEHDPKAALESFESILQDSPVSPRGLYGKALSLKKLAELERSNAQLEAAIVTLQGLLSSSKVPDELFKLAGSETVSLLKFRGWNGKAVGVLNGLIERFPEDDSFSKDLGVLYLIMGQNDNALGVFEDVLKESPEDGFALTHIGFVHKILAQSNEELETAVSFLDKGIASKADGVLEGNFFFHLGDALSRLGRKEEADRVYQEGADLGIFRSFWQRSLYNLPNLKAQPIWTAEETGVPDELEAIRSQWEKIRDEVLLVRNESVGGFLHEAESLLDSGLWKQFEIYRQGRKIKKNCAKTPFTCSLFEHFPPARTNNRGQIKFSVMSTGTHVHAHSGPTNTRLRIHLPLLVPSTATPDNLRLRVADGYHTWSEGQLLIFDDSFDHEVWNTSGEERMVLIFDIWHPEISTETASTLPAI